MIRKRGMICFKNHPLNILGIRAIVVVKGFLGTDYLIFVTRIRHRDRSAIIFGYPCTINININIVLLLLVTSTILLVVNKKTVF